MLKALIAYLLLLNASCLAMDVRLVINRPTVIKPNSQVKYNLVWQNHSTLSGSWLSFSPLDILCYSNSHFSDKKESFQISQMQGHENDVPVTKVTELGMNIVYPNGNSVWDFYADLNSTKPYARVVSGERFYGMKLCGWGDGQEGVTVLLPEVVKGIKGLFPSEESYIVISLVD